MKRQKGMTIIEMLVVFVIIAILLSMVFINYRQIQRRTILDSTAYKLASDIRKQQSASGLDDTDCNDIGYKYSTGIYVNAGDTGYDLFSDCDASNSKDSLEVRKTVDIPNEIAIESVSPAPLNVVFYPPNPSVIVNGDNNATATIVISLKSEPAIKKTIIVNKVGMIEIN